MPWVPVASSRVDPMPPVIAVNLGLCTDANPIIYLEPNVISNKQNKQKIEQISVNLSHYIKVAFTMYHLIPMFKHIVHFTVFTGVMY